MEENICNKCGKKIVLYPDEGWLHDDEKLDKDHDPGPANLQAPPQEGDVAEHSVAIGPPPTRFPTFTIKLPIVARGEGTSVHMDGVDLTRGLRRVEVKGRFDEPTTVILEFLGEVEAEVHAAFEIVMKADQEARTAAQDEPGDSDDYAKMIDATVEWLSASMARGETPEYIYEKVDWAGHSGMTAQMAWGAAASQQEPFTKQKMLDYWNNRHAPGVDVPEGMMADITTITINSGDTDEGERPEVEDHQAPEGGDGN